ncbi:putative OTU-like cysteine protease [Blattamonas nauphoetae]|uniref:OTU-like cysteine protease n=1 Tax=Blattamonas nauphoetae TaxID=2049346 RepID=A0ABQ9YF83_9EUKA|nr:putative OTU-like cysteine protease [Blattamonas nauphoetae]
MHTLTEQLAPFGFRIIDVPLDGNCFFSSVSHQLYSDPKHSANLRKLTCDYIAEHQADLAHFLLDNEDFDEYLSDMREDGTWADNIAILSLSNALQIGIEIMQPSHPAVMINQTYPRRIRVGYVGESHYVSVVGGEERNEADREMVRQMIDQLRVTRARQVEMEAEQEEDEVPQPAPPQEEEDSEQHLPPALRKKNRKQAEQAREEPREPSRQRESKPKETKSTKKLTKAEKRAQRQKRARGEDSDS